MQDFAYGPLGMDRSDIGRQTVTRSMNVLYLPDTIRALKGSASAMLSGERAVQINDAIKTALEAKGITPKMADWRSSSDFLNRESGASKFFNWIPGYEPLNRGFATMTNMQRYGPVLTMAEKNPNLTPAQLQHIANYSAITTGRGTFGPADKQIANVLGPVMTSARYAASWPERMTYLFPAQKVGGNLELFGPTWQMAVKDQGGFIATGVGIMGLASLGGGNVNWKTGDISFGDHHYNIWGGGYGWAKMAYEAYTGTKYNEYADKFKDYPRLLEKDDAGKWKGTIAEFFRNKAGPLPEDTMAAIKASGLDKKLGIENITNFLRPEYWDKGATGKNLGVLDRALQFGSFLWMQDVAKAVWGTVDKPGLNLESAKAGATALPSIIGVTTSTYHPGGDLAALRDDLKGDARLPEAIRGTDYNNLGPDGKAAVDAVVKQDKPTEYDQAIKDRNENAAPAIQKYHDTTEKITQQEEQRKNDLYNMLREGKIDGEQLRQGRAVINSSANAQREAARNDPDYKKAVSESDKNEVSKALDVYYAISKAIPNLPNGKPDYDRIEAQRADFLKFAERKDPETAKLLRFEIGTSKEATNRIDQLYAAAQPLLDKYYGIKDDYARAQAQRANPHDDAFLALLGYGKTQTPEALRILNEMRANLPALTAPVQRSMAPAGVGGQAPAPMAQSAPIGPNGRSVAEITGKPYLSDEERNWYFQSRGLPVPNASAPAPSRSAPPTGATAAPTGATLPPVVKDDTQQRQNFIGAMSAPAQEYARSTGIPPAVWAAMGASESNWGRADSVFGIKGVGTAGGKNYDTHEVYGGKTEYIKDQFAAYNNLDEAFKHFVDFTSIGRYAPAKDYLDRTGDWQGFLHQINQAGYATAPNWADSIINLAGYIEKNYPYINGR